MRILIKNASLVLEDRVEAGDLLTEGRRIVQIGGTIDAPADRVIDAAGCYVFPGFIDTHTHFDLEVGSTVTADDFVTGTKAAVIGGTTTVLDFATQERGMTMMGAFRKWENKAKSSSCNYGFHMAVSEWNDARIAEVPLMIENGVTSFKMYMVYDNMRLSDGVMYEAIKHLAKEDCIIGIHCENDDIIKVAIVGKPNVGKSSLLNRILGEERVIVSNVAGTTRDAIDSYFENETGKYCFIDTAGMRRKSKVDDAIEKYSNMRSINAIERADVCLILIDANDGVTEQDTKIAGLVHEAGKAAIIVVNKWDAVENKETNTMRDMEAEVRDGLSYMTYAPVLFLSALTGQRVDKLYQVIQEVHTQNTMRITTGALNSVLADATARVQPPTDKGRRLKIYYMTQASSKPPHFVIFCNDARLFHFSYQRYLENQIREVFGLKGTPVRITIRQKGDKEDG